MNKLTYAAMTSLIALSLPVFSQNDKTSVKKPTETTVKQAPKTIYFIDGVRTDNVYDYVKIKSEDVSYMSIVTNPTEIKQYTRKEDNVVTVIVIETVTKKPLSEREPIVTAKGKVKVTPAN